jgi:hypothetical protein
MEWKSIGLAAPISEDLPRPSEEEQQMFHVEHFSDAVGIHGLFHVEHLL